MKKQLKPTFIQWARFIMQYKTMLNYIDNDKLIYLRQLIDKQENKRKKAKQK